MAFLLGACFPKMQEILGHPADNPPSKLTPCKTKPKTPRPNSVCGSRTPKILKSLCSSNHTHPLLFHRRTHVLLGPIALIFDA